MRYNCIWLLMLILLNGCASTTTAQTVLPKVLPSSGGNSASHDKLLNSVDPALIEKVKSTFAAVFNNDDKKAKLLYGRNYKYMPEAIQFALDVRFKNYEHAQTVLSNTGDSPEEITFWQNILTQKPARFSAGICKEFLSRSGFPSQGLEPSAIESAWSSQIRSLGDSLTVVKEEPSDSSSAVVDSGLDQSLSKLSCNADKCEPLSSDDQKMIFSETYFDKLHNLQRRDTAYVVANYRNFVKVRTHRRYISAKNILNLFNAIEATENPRKEHFLRRIKGIGRDLRPESLSARFIGDKILGDEKDQKTYERLKVLVDANPIMADSIGLEYELATCGLSNGKSEPAKP